MSEPDATEEQEIQAFAAAVREGFAEHQPDVRYLERMFRDDGPVVAVVLHGIPILSPELDRVRSAVVAIARQAFAGRAFQVVTCADGDDRARWCLTGQPVAITLGPTSTLVMPLCRETHRILRLSQVSAKLWC